MKIRTIASLLLAFLFTASSVDGFCQAFQEWQQAPELWRNGYVFATAGYLASVVSSDNPQERAVVFGYKQCLKGMSDATMVASVNNYYLRHPEAMPLPLVIVVMNAMREMCASFLPK